MVDSYLVTTPIYLTDAEQFYELCEDEKIKEEFTFLKLKSVEDAHQFLNTQIQIYKSSEGYIFKAIRLVFDELVEVYDDTNNILIGFIILCGSIAPFEHALLSGFRNNIYFGITASYREMGFMTMAIEMTLEAMMADGYNLLPALVKGENIPAVKVLQKCGFDKYSEKFGATLFVRRLNMDLDKYNSFLKTKY